MASAEELLAQAQQLEKTIDGYSEQEETEQAVEDLLRAAAAQDLPRALAELGAFLWHVREDDEEALPFLLRAAEAGEADAMNLVGDINDFRGDTDEAIAWYRRGAELGDPQAAGSLAALTG